VRLILLQLACVQKANPTKQGLKQWTQEPEEKPEEQVQKANPTKQGLKHFWGDVQV
jgi:hypothetical protein